MPDPSEPTDDVAVPELDAVLAQVGRLGDRPVSEHVEVYETAHRQLRQILDAH